MSAKDVKALLTALASHRKRKMRERARAAPAEQQTPGGLEVQVGGASPLPALTGPRTVASS
jgi:hypothetical protein